jgi:fructokinase
VIYGGIEAGGTKWVCAVGTGPDDVRASVVFPTGAPDETIGRAIDFLRDAGEPLAAVGVGSFGPVDLHASSPTWGRITTTPKPGWRDVDLAPALAEALAVPVGFDTDVNAAALGEHRWGAAQGLETFCYLTVGTGIGGGAMAGGRLVHGLLHPEMGHARIPHDRARDPFDGSCPYHGDCFEGLASGRAVAERWPDVRRGAWPGEVLALEAHYLALGLVNVLAVLSPQRIVLGGGVMKTPGLLERVRSELRGVAGGYFDAPELAEGIEEYVVSPALGDRSGVLGALELGRLAAEAA